VQGKFKTKAKTKEEIISTVVLRFTKDAGDIGLQYIYIAGNSRGKKFY
jgi:hypothetical protein